MINIKLYTIYYYVDGKLKKGSFKEVASLFSIPIRTIQHIWKSSNSGILGDVSHKKTKNCGQKRV